MRSSNSPPRAAFISLMLVATMLAMCSLVGCGSIPTEDARAQAATYNAVWPRHEKYLDADKDLTAQDKADYKQTGVTWRDKIATLLKSAGVPYLFENGRFTVNDALTRRDSPRPNIDLRQPLILERPVMLEGHKPDRFAPYDRLAVRQDALGPGPGMAC